ncbi:metabolism of cobalamin associated Db [Brachionichthys hirsutus]|uniref:metabolism of cobalamin associated Db n=1 Tax=Brachionichthys hirsutus TaxID=412623 RepID=UPI003604C1A3
MATATVLCRRARRVTFLPGLHVLVRRVTGARLANAAGSNMAAAPSDPGLRMDLSDEGVGPVGPVGRLDHRLEARLEEWKNTPLRPVPGGDSALSGAERQKLMLTQYMDEFCEKDDGVLSPDVGRAGQCFDISTVECAVQSCPEPLKKDFRSMFPEAPSPDVTVVTVTQKTQNDMTSWSSDVEEEREQLLDKFIAGAKQICCALQREGFWADFIDPASGLAFFGCYTNNTLFETDERYRHLGFQIEDLGCCRVIQHSLWGTHIFVGTIFTSAPPSSLVMKTLQSS